MPISTFKVDLASIEPAKLETDDDLRRQARKLLPDVLSKIGETIGASTWTQLQNGLRGSPGFQARASLSEKRKFIRDVGQAYCREASQQERWAVEQTIVEQLRELMGSADHAKQSL